MTMNRRFDYLLYDGFNAVASRWCDLLVFSESVENIIVFAELGEEQRLMMLRWAKQKGISLLGVLPRPVKTHYLHELMSFRETSKVSVEIADR